jgi:hypothetical protein
MTMTVVVVGSAQPGREYEPPLRQAEQAERAAEELGRELALRGCSIVVHSSDEAFIEGAVVRGYVASGEARPRSIQVRPRYGRSDDLGFPEIARHKELFNTMPEVTSDWEVSFYRSLLLVDGILLVGGGGSTFLAGLIALSRRCPLLTVATFGANAEKVWQRFAKEPNWASQEELAVMAEAWDDTLASRLIDSLISQHERHESNRRQTEQGTRAANRQLTTGMMSCALMLICALGTIPLSYSISSGTAWSIALLVAAPLLAASCGALVGNAIDSRSEWIRSAVLGAAAGTIAFLLFVAAQLAATPDALRDGGVSRLLYFVIPVAFIGGLTFDAVYRKLRGQDVTSTAAITSSDPPPR